MKLDIFIAQISSQFRRNGFGCL